MIRVEGGGHGYGRNGAVMRGEVGVMSMGVAGVMDIGEGCHGHG